jgi:hypothetical protein
MIDDHRERQFTQHFGVGHHVVGIDVEVENSAMRLYAFDGAEAIGPLCNGYFAGNFVAVGYDATSRDQL